MAGTQLEPDRIDDERAIRDCIARYCRGIDRIDLDLVRSCYHPDAVDEHGDIGGDIDTYIAYLAQSLPRADAGTHFIGNQLIEVAGDRAFVETYVFAISRRRGDQAVIQHTSAVRFLDRFERREGEWRIAHRRAVMDWSRIDPGGGVWEQEASYIAGRRDRDDPLYAARVEALGR